jgi:hypothetical protein
MKFCLLIISTLVPFVVSGAELKGTAKNAKGEVVYLESHEIVKDETDLNKFIKVEYKKLDGSVFAVMTSDFSKNKFVPETVFEDKRFSTKTTLKIAGDSLEFEEFKNGIAKSKKKIPLKETMVAGQGFDNFIRANAAKLESKPITFSFGVLEKKDFFSLTGYRRPSSSAETLEFGIKASSWIIRLFTQELKVVYEKEKKRLKSFVGTSNILTDKGESQNVSIHYEWVVGND